MKLLIESDGAADNTRVFSSAGIELTGVSKIEFLPIEHGGTVKAVLTFDLVSLKMKAEIADVKFPEDLAIEETLRKILVQ